MANLVQRPRPVSTEAAHIGGQSAAQRQFQSIPMSGPSLTSAEREAVNRVLDTSTLSMGPELEAFEAALAAYTGTRYAVGVNSGTSGLHLCMIASNIQANDLVITTPFSFVASANCILYERGIPIFVDVDPATGNIDPHLVAEAIEELVQASPMAARWLPPALRHERALATANRLKAILLVHTFGQPVDMDPLLDVARQHGLTVVEDACEAIGATYKGRQAGNLGDAAVFAFYPNKQITTGEGGAVVTNNEAWAALMRSLRNQGRDMFNTWLTHERLGYNYRLDEMSAALGLAQLERVEELLACRAQVARWYNERLANRELVECPYVAPTTSRMSWFVYVVRLATAVDRDELIDRLAAVGIPTRPYFTPIHLQPFYVRRFGYERGDFPKTEYLGDVSLALPFFSSMTEMQVDYVCEHLLTTLAERAQPRRASAKGR